MSNFIESHLYKTTGVSDVTLIAKHVLQHRDEFETLYQFTSNADSRIAWHALWVCEKLCDMDKSFFYPKRNELIARLTQCTHSGLSRIMLNIISELQTDDDISVELLNCCLDNITNAYQPVSVQCASLKLAYELCKSEPDLLNELKLIIDGAMSENRSAGWLSVEKKILKKIDTSAQVQELNKIIKNV